MRKLIGVLLLGVGCAAGAASWAGWTRASAVHAQGFGAETRFVMGPFESVAVGREKSALTLRFIRDRRTNDCYLITMGDGQSIATLTKTEDDACSGF
jgi:hypothetical protein